MGIAVPKPTFGRLKPKQGKRGEFSKLTRDLIYERDEGACRVCGVPAEEVHHRQIHDNPELAYFWQHTFENLYGTRYWADQYDD